MAVVFNGLVTKLPEADIPDGFVQGAVVAIARSAQNFVSVNTDFDNTKASVQNASDLVTFQAIYDAVEADILAYLIASFDNTNTVTAHAIWNNISTNTDKGAASFYINDATIYKAHVVIYISVV